MCVKACQWCQGDKNGIRCSRFWVLVSGIIHQAFHVIPHLCLVIEPSPRSIFTRELVWDSQVEAQAFGTTLAGFSRHELDFE